MFLEPPIGGSAVFYPNTIFSEYSLVVNPGFVKNVQEVLDRVIYFGI